VELDRSVITSRAAESNVDPSEGSPLAPWTSHTLLNSLSSLLDHARDTLRHDPGLQTSTDYDILILTPASTTISRATKSRSNASQLRFVDTRQVKGRATGRRFIQSE
jgi:hypothetical protein